MKPSGLFIIVGLCLLADTVDGIEGYFKIKPNSKVFHKGETATLECDADYAHRVVWYHNSSATMISDNYQILRTDDGRNNKYEVCCSKPQRTYTLTINNFQPIDAGLYSCMILEEHNDVFKQASAVLSIDPPGVMTAPDDASPSCDMISIKTGTSGLLDAGDVIEFICQSQGGLPASQLTLAVGDEVIDSPVTETEFDNVTSVTKVHHNVSLTVLHINSVFKCKLVSAALTAPRNCTLTPLTLGAFIQPSNTEATEGSDIVLECSPTGAIQPEFEWFLNNSINGCANISEVFNQSIIIKNAPLTLNGCQLVCLVRDHGSEVSVSVTLSIKPEVSPTDNTITRFVSQNQVDMRSLTQARTGTNVAIGVVVSVFILFIISIVVLKLRRPCLNELNSHKTDSLNMIDQPRQTDTQTNEQAEPPPIKTLVHKESDELSNNEAEYGNIQVGNMTAKTQEQNSNIYTYENYTVDKALENETCYQNVPTTVNYGNANNVEGLNYAELDLDESSSGIRDNEQKTVYSNVVV